MIDLLIGIALNSKVKIIQRNSQVKLISQSEVVRSCHPYIINASECMCIYCTTYECFYVFSSYEVNLQSFLRSKLYMKNQQPIVLE